VTVPATPELVVVIGAPNWDVSCGHMISPLPAEQHQALARSSGSNSSGLSRRMGTVNQFVRSPPTPLLR
jgi:hypothetical protein